MSLESRCHPWRVVSCCSWSTRVTDNYLSVCHCSPKESFAARQTPRRGACNPTARGCFLALTFGTLLSSQGSDAHRLRSLDRSRGNLPNLSGAVLQCQTVAARPGKSGTVARTRPKKPLSFSQGWPANRAPASRAAGVRCSGGVDEVTSRWRLRQIAASDGRFRAQNAPACADTDRRPTAAVTIL
jgi:hypothetical protein